MKATQISKMVGLIATVLLVTGVSSAEDTQLSGVVGTAPTLRVGDRVNDIPFLGKNEKQYYFSKVRKPITILAFIENQEHQGDMVNTDLAKLANQFKENLITVAQISISNTDSKDQQRIVKSSQSKNQHLALLNDSQKIAWKLYKKPKPNTVFLIDESGTIKAIEPMKNLAYITKKAKRLSSLREQIEMAFESYD